MQSREDTMGSPRKKRLKSLRRRWFNILSSKQLSYLPTRKTTGGCERERVAAERDKQRQRRNLNSCAPRAGQAKEKRLKNSYLEVST